MSEEMISTEKLRDIYDNISTGTSTYYGLGFVNITDGMKAVADAAGAYWLCTDIGAVMITMPEIRKHRIVFWELIVKDDHTATLDAWQDVPNESEHLYHQEYGYTNFPVGKWMFYWQDDVLFLPSEY